MVLEFSNLTAEEVKYGYKTQGDLNGNYQEVTDFLAWTINCPKTDNAKHLKMAIETITKRFMPHVTTEYLRQFAERKDSSNRLHYLLSESGFTTCPTKRYFREMRSSKSKLRQTIKCLDGTFKEKTYDLGKTSYNFVGKVLHKVITKAEADALIRKFQEQNNKSMLMRDLKEAVKGNPYSPIGHIMEFETTARTEKVIRKLANVGKYFPGLKCKICKHEIKIATFEDIETSEVVETVWVRAIKPALDSIQKGEYLCRTCTDKHEAMLKENNMFDMSGILKQLTELKGIAIGDNKNFSTPTLSFMMEFYRDIGLPSTLRVEKILEKAKDTLEMNCEIKVKLDKIEFRFN